MNKQQLALQRAKVWKSYHIPSLQNYYRRPKNAIYISPSNSLKHEIGKLMACYDLLKEGKQFITEAVDNKTGLRRDIVCLDDGLIKEIETDPKRAKRHKEDNVEVVMVCEKP